MLELILPLKRVIRTLFIERPGRRWADLFTTAEDRSENGGFPHLIKA